MNGPHDLGGQMDFGPIAPETEEPLFHGEWEKKALGLTLCAGALGLWTIDESRHARERLHPADYYSSTYYEIWVKALEQLLLEHGCVGRDELDAGRALRSSSIDTSPLAADRVAALLAAGGPCDRPATTEARFRTGDRVRMKNIHPAGHTRLPRYVRGRAGIVEEVAGTYVLPDDNAHGRGENPQWLYRVVFEGRELWGPDADPTLSVSVDAWEPYIDPA